MGVPTPYSGKFFPSILTQFKNDSISQYEFELKYSFKSPFNETYLLILSEAQNPEVSSTNVMLGANKGKADLYISYQKENETVRYGFTLPDQDFSEHMVRLTFDEKSISVYLDGEFKGTKEFFGSAKLQYIWLGYWVPSIYDRSVPTQWGSFSIDYLRANITKP